MINKFNPVYKPFVYSWAEDIRKRHEKVHWVPEEADLTADAEQWRHTLTDDERGLTKNLLSMFTQSDEGVGKFYLDYLLPRVANNEIRNMLVSFASREAIHQEGYALLNDTLGLGDEFWNDFMTHPETLAKWEYLIEEQHYDNLGIMLAKQVAFEGVSLFASFTMLKNFERFGKLLGTCKINEWSLRDETIHVEGNSKLFRQWCIENPHEVNDNFKKTIYDVFRKVTQLELDFIDMAFGSYTIQGLDKEEVKLYIKYIADRRLLQLGLKENYMIEHNPLPWMDELTGGSSVQNFFEGRVADYSVAGFSGVYLY